MISKFSLISRLFLALMVVLLTLYLLFMNTIPFSVDSHLSLDDSRKVSNLGPANRLTFSNGTYSITQTPVYFSTRVPYEYDTASVKILYRQKFDEAPISVGYKNGPDWDYNQKLLSAPILDKSNLVPTSSFPYLYQRNSQYKSLNEFIANPPQDRKPIGLYKTSIDSNEVESMLDNYTPAVSETVIDTGLRGSLTFYTYLEKERFNFSFTKFDLNWYQGTDDLRIRVSKQGDKVYEALLKDDGNISADRQIGKSQTINISNPGPGLPESGVYKIEVISTRDSILSEIRTNLNKLAFTSPLYLAESKSYSTNKTSDIPSNIITNSRKLDISIDHLSASQVVTVNQTQKTGIRSTEETYKIPLSGGLNTVNITDSDILLEGDGFLSFDRNHFFNPYTVNTEIINSGEDIQNLDYILSSYNGKSTSLGNGWFTNEVTFDLSDAYYANDHLEWILQPEINPGSNSSLEVKTIDINYHRKGWLDK